MMEGEHIPPCGMCARQTTLIVACRGGNRCLNGWPGNRCMVGRWPLAGRRWTPEENALRAGLTDHCAVKLAILHTGRLHYLHIPDEAAIGCGIQQIVRWDQALVIGDVVIVPDAGVWRRRDAIDDDHILLARGKWARALPEKLWSIFGGEERAIIGRKQGNVRDGERRPRWGGCRWGCFRRGRCICRGGRGHRCIRHRRCRRFRRRRAGG